MLAASDLSVNEGETPSLQLATFTDPEPSDVHTATIDWGDGASTAGAVNESGGSGTVSGSHAYADDGSYTVAVTVTDDVGNADTDGLTIIVSNVAPTVIAGPDRTAAAGAENEIDTLRFADPGTADTHTATIDWGDGVTTQPTINAQVKALAGVHTYESTGLFAVTITVTDDDGGSGSDTIDITVSSSPATVTIVPIPSVAEWGLIGLAIVLAALATLELARRATQR